MVRNFSRKNVGTKTVLPIYSECRADNRTPFVQKPFVRKMDSRPQWYTDKRPWGPKHLSQKVTRWTKAPGWILQLGLKNWMNSTTRTKKPGWILQLGQKTWMNFTTRTMFVTIVFMFVVLLYVIILFPSAHIRILKCYNFTMLMLYSIRQVKTLW